jgi:integrative and conjugative element protein (TIGR02256 family)
MREVAAYRNGFGPTIVVPLTILGGMRAFQSGEQANTEAGGILIGSYRARDLEIVDFTCPMKLDVRRRYSFDRRDPGHQAAARAAWERSRRTETFIGEWHTHPEPNPTPSPLDRRTWKTALADAAPRPLIFTICGQHETRIWFGFPGKVVELERVYEELEET